jgi:hypothetical protein
MIATPYHVATVRFYTNGACEKIKSENADNLKRLVVKVSPLSLLLARTLMHRYQCFYYLQIVKLNPLVHCFSILYILVTR